jgi:hypothetical protein
MGSIMTGRRPGTIRYANHSGRRFFYPATRRARKLYFARDSAEVQTTGAFFLACSRA